MNPNGRLIINHDRDEEDNLTLFISGDLDVQTAPQLRNFIDSLLRDGAVSMKLDLSQLSYLDSSGYVALVDATRRTRRSRCPLNLTNMPPWITEFFDMSVLNG